MLKSTKENQQHVYRIVKVLASQDYLCIDQQQHQYILAPHGAYRTNVRAEGKSSNKHQPSRIIPVVQCITMDKMSYSLFEVGTSSMQWAKDIDSKQLQTHSFIETFIKEAVTYILQRILWMDPRHALSIIHVNNLWMLDGQVNLLEMPRTIALPKTQGKRSYSHEPVSMSAIIDKELNIIKRLAECLWQILFQSEPSQLKGNHSQISRLLLMKMINRQLSFQDIMTEVQQLTLDSMNTILKRHKYKSPLRKELFSRKRYSEPHSLTLNTGKKKRNSLHNLTSTLMSRVSAQDRVFEYRKRCTTLPVPRPTKNLMEFNQGSLMQRAKLTEPRQFLSANAMASYTPKKIMKTTPKRQSFAKYSNQGDRDRYLDWLKAHKFNLITPSQQKIQALEQKRRSINNSEVSQQKQSNRPNNDDQLKKRLLDKIEKYRTARYCKSVSTQTVSSQVESFHSPEGYQCIQSNRFSDNPDQVEDKGVIIALNQKVLFPNKKIEDWPSQQQAGRKNSFHQLSSQKIGPHLQEEPIAKKLTYEVPTNRKFVYEEKRQKLKKQTCLSAVSMQKQPICQGNVHNVQQQAIEEVCLSTQRNKQHKIFTVPFQSVESSRSSARKQQTPSIARQYKINNTKFAVDCPDLEDIETITFGPQKTNKTIPVPKPKIRAQEYVLQKSPFSSSDPTLKPQFIQQNQYTQNCRQPSSEDLLTSLAASIQQYLTLINILADISVNCVRNKADLKQTKWRVSVFFLYQRFYWQRVQLLKHLKSGQLQKIVRKDRQISPKSKQLWLTSEHRSKLIDQIDKENNNISQTYQRLAKKTLEECELQPNIQRFISNRDQILKNSKVTVRPFLSKYAVAFIINEFDQLLEKTHPNAKEIDYILRCVFGLQILAQIDGKQHKNDSLHLGQYNKARKLKELSESVERIYDLYYPENEGEGV